jgi:hypothetical protein
VDAWGGFQAWDSSVLFLYNARKKNRKKPKSGTKGIKNRLSKPGEEKKLG